LTEPLGGRVALVTGASGGIGAAVARALAAEGVSVAAGYGGNGAPAEALARELSGTGVRAQAFGCDLADPEGPQRLLAAVTAALGPVDVLVAAHGAGERAGYEDVDAGLFDRTMAVNLRAPFLLAQGVLPGMRERRWGRVLFVSSTAAHTGGLVGPHYAASKAGLHGLTHFLSARVSGEGVTVNAVAPALIDTPMLPGDTSELAKRIPVGRIGTPAEVADLCLAVVRNGYITSHVLDVDGGLYPR
jgi:3-oxoacyl-[acyl-carrier protein] reductase